jgi:hypothetical protein
MIKINKALKKEEEMLVAVAETIGGTLGTISAKAAQARRALIGAKSTGTRTAKQTARRLGVSLKTARKRATRAATKARSTRRKSATPSSKTVRRGRKAVRSRMR